jgi:hypothetical protein
MITGRHRSSTELGTSSDDTSACHSVTAAESCRAERDDLAVCT